MRSRLQCTTLSYDGLTFDTNKIVANFGTILVNQKHWRSANASCALTKHTVCQIDTWYMSQCVLRDTW